MEGKRQRGDTWEERWRERDRGEPTKGKRQWRTDMGKETCKKGEREERGGEEGEREGERDRKEETQGRDIVGDPYKRRR